MTTSPAALDDLFARFVETLLVEGRRLDPSSLCGGDHQLLAALLARIAKYEEVDGLLSSRRRLRLGRRLGDYEILDEIGRGGMAIVYLARRTRDGARLALKLFPPEREADAEQLARFEREAKVIQRLDHPNIVKFHSIEQVEGLRFLTMDFVDGVTLAQALPADGFPLDDVIAIGTALASALALVHREGVVHRDLKLANLMWTRDRELRILDFGLARLLGESTESLTRTGDVLGTLGGMAPEQLLGEKVDARSDLFSLGAVLQHLATGRPAFRGESLAARVEAVLDRPPEPLPAGLETLGMVISRCLAKDPGGRPTSAEVVEDELRAIAAARR